MNKSEDIKDLAAALAVAQGQIQDATKSSNNPFFKSKYADLSEVISCTREPLSKNGLSVIQMPSYANDTGVASVETMLMHKSGQWISSISSAPVSKKDAQGIGSATTYLRRYSLSAVAGITQKDDDGEGAVGRETKGNNKNTAKINAKQVADLTALADEVKANVEGFLKFLKVDSISEIPADKFDYAVKSLEAKRG